jgi:hypothetical protein
MARNLAWGMVRMDNIVALFEHYITEYSGLLWGLGSVGHVGFAPLRLLLYLPLGGRDALCTPMALARG